jgi:hypothetical protein
VMPDAAALQSEGLEFEALRTIRFASHSRARFSNT